MITPTRLLLIALSCVTQLVLHGIAHAENDGSISIDNAWIAEAPPVSKVMVAYMTITNNSDKDIRLIKASSSSYSSIEFHETVHQDGLASMVRHESLVVPATSKLELKPGSKHLMLFNPVKWFKAGDKIEFTFATDDNSSVSRTITVIKPQY